MGLKTHWAKCGTCSLALMNGETAPVLFHHMYVLLQAPVQPEVERVLETIAAPSASLNTASVMASTDEEDMTQEAKQCVQALREGKRYPFTAACCQLGLVCSEQGSPRLSPHLRSCRSCL